ncbi:MAG: carboxymuconolactone decarboxylase family protein [Solirubrobacterales bacterium]
MTPRVAVATGIQARIATFFARRQYGAEIVESVGVYAQNPRLMNWLVVYNRAVEKQDRVPARLRDLAVLKAATIVECEFCIDIGSEYARRSGLSDEQLLALHDAEASGLFDDEELLIINYARAMSVTPPAVDDQHVAALRERYGDRGVLELTHLIAWENTRARTNAALGIGAGGFSEGRACAIAASSNQRAAPAHAG